MEETNFDLNNDEDAFRETIPYVETQPKFEGFFADAEDQSCSVKVAMRIRPLN